MASTTATAQAAPTPREATTIPVSVRRAMTIASGARGMAMTAAIADGGASRVTPAMASMGGGVRSILSGARVRSGPHTRTAHTHMRTARRGPCSRRDARALGIADGMSVGMTTNSLGQYASCLIQPHAYLLLKLPNRSC